MQLVHVGVQSPEAFEAISGPDLVAELRQLARDLQGLRLLHVNAIPYGGGVSELLRSLVPLLRGLGIEAEWRVMAADQSFFRVTKSVHNALQGAPMAVMQDERDAYLAGNRQNAESLDADYDVIFVHDPQPAAIRQFATARARHWVWRCHIDTSQPSPAVWDFLRGILEPYEAYIFTMQSFVPPNFDGQRVVIEAPGIDPLSPKNLPLPQALARRIVQWVGVDLERPLVTQVSRFDRWKDPLGVIEVYRRMRTEVPDLQLALLGSMALDDPEGWDMYRQIVDEAHDDPGVSVFTNLTGISDVEVNAFQTLSDVVIQKSIREGFGLVVSETLWKGTPIVAGRAGGIPLQFPPEDADLLVDDVESCAARALELLHDPHKAKEQGMRGREWVKDRFLLPRLAADDLRLIRRVLRLSDVTG